MSPVRWTPANWRQHGVPEMPHVLDLDQGSGSVPVAARILRSQAVARASVRDRGEPLIHCFPLCAR